MFVASPWSAPSWLKNWNSLIPYSNENTLIDNDQVYSTYANYFAKVIQAMTDRGVEVQFVTLQNEPLFGDSSQYPGMYLSSDQAIRLAKAVTQVLPSNIKILSYDHNWDHPEYPLNMLQAIPEQMGGVAWHCYGGDMATALDSVHSKYPSGVDQHITECTGSYPDTCDINQGLAGFGNNHEWDMNNLFLGASSHFAVSGIKWIMALDENCGPTLPLVTYKTGRPLVSVPSWASSIDDIKFNQDYWTIAHMSKFIAPGAVRVESNAWTSSSIANITQHKNVAASAGDVLTETFFHQQSGLVTTIAMNLNHWTDRSISISDGDWANTFSYTIPKFSTAVFQWYK